LWGIGFSDIFYPESRKESEDITETYQKTVEKIKSFT